MYEVIEAGIEAFDVFTKSGRFAGMISKQPKGHWNLYFNCSASKGSKRKFATAHDAIEFMHQRRINKGLATQ